MSGFTKIYFTCLVVLKNVPIILLYVARSSSIYSDVFEQRRVDFVIAEPLFLQYYKSIVSVHKMHFS